MHTRKILIIEVMALYREQIEHYLGGTLTSKRSKIRKWMKKQMNRFIRRKPIEDDEQGSKGSKRQYNGYEY